MSTMIVVARTRSRLLTAGLAVFILFGRNGLGSAAAVAQKSRRAPPTFATLVPDGRIAQRASVAEASYSLEIVTVPSTESREDLSYRWWGGAAGSLIVGDLQIRWRGKPVAVPLSCYSDLAHIWKIRLYGKTRRCAIALSGGDASYSYDATISLRGGQVISRSVHNHAYPSLDYETTKYVRKELPGDAP